MFAFVSTGGKSKGCEKGAGVGVGVGVPIGREAFGAPPNRTPIVASAAPMTSSVKGLKRIPLFRELQQNQSYRPGPATTGVSMLVFVLTAIFALSVYRSHRHCETNRLLGGTMVGPKVLAVERE